NSAALESASDADSRAGLDAIGSDVFVSEKNVSIGRTDVSGENGQQRTLSRAVGADHGMNLAGIEFEIDGIHCKQPAKILRDLLRAQKWLNHAATVANRALRDARHKAPPRPGPPVRRR